MSANYTIKSLYVRSNEWVGEQKHDETKTMNGIWIQSDWEIPKAGFPK